MRCFSLTCDAPTHYYDDQLVPLLRRMCNLKELTLIFGIKRLNCNDFLDGKRLYNHFMMHLPQLQKFRFSIITLLFQTEKPIHLTSNDDVQRTFTRNIFGHVGSYVNHLPKASQSMCHVYSMPFAFDLFTRLNQSFTGGTFHRVRKLWVTLFRPSEQDFLKKIEERFPSLETLYIFGVQLGDHKRKPTTTTSSRITFPRLTYLNLQFSYLDNIKQVLADEFIYLPRLREFHGE